MRQARIAPFLLLLLLAVTAFLFGQSQTAVDPSVPAAPHEKQIRLKHILVIGQTKGFEHDSVSDGMAAIYNMGRESGLWDAILRTDSELLTKKDLGRNAKNSRLFRRHCLR